MELNFDEAMIELREKLKKLGKQIMQQKEIISQEAKEGKTPVIEDTGEVMANLMLAYRHVEDASMRIRKVMQARNGGVSVYDKNVVGSPE
jgi:hypothetical protein